MFLPAVMSGWKLQMAMLALYCITGEAFGSSDGCFHWCQVEMSPYVVVADVGLAMHNSSWLVDSEFECLQNGGMTCPAMDGCRDGGNGRQDKDQWSYAPMDDWVKSSWFQFGVTGLDAAGWISSSLSFLATMAFLGALLASNSLSFNVLAVIGGQEIPVAVLNSAARVFFCFKQLQKQKHAWKQKSRLEKRKSRLGQRVLMRQMQVLVWFSLFSNCWAMDVNVAQQITELAQAATRAAQAATTVAEKFGSKGMSAGMESATKVLKNPDGFNGEDAASFMGWKLNFETWMSYGDERFNDLLGKVERMDRAPSYASYDSEQKSMANKFFATLSSYLRGRTSALVRSVANGDKDGFKLGYELCREYLPTSKQRTLSLAQTLAQYPQFSNKASMLEQILNFEQLVGQYESSSGNTYPADLKAATILVENICMMLEGVIDPADVRTELEHLEQGMVDNLEMKDAIKWLTDALVRSMTRSNGPLRRIARQRSQ